MKTERGTCVVADNRLATEWFGPEMVNARKARHWAEPLLASWRFDGDLPLVLVVLSELVTNAIEHAGTRFCVELALHDDVLRIAVHDSSASMPALRQPAADQTRGRGLVAVDALADRWGVEHVRGGKIVWAELTCAPA